MTPIRSLSIVTGLLASVACSPATLDSRAGRHVTLYWNPSEQPLCGGTIAYIDASLEIVAEAYDVELPERAGIQLLWTQDPSVAQGLCATPTSGCAITLPNGVSHVVSDDPIDPHELTHAVRVAGPRTSLPSFFHEGLAVRWEYGFADTSAGKATYIGDLDAERLRELLDGGRIEADAYPEAGFLWSWLEAEHGPARMAEFADQLSWLASTKSIERAFEASFGVSLDEAVEASAGQPLWAFDVHACAMADLPVLEWTGAPLTLVDGPEDCASAEVYNSLTIANRSTRLVLPDAPTNYTLTITGDSPSQVRFDPCTGSPRPFEDALTYTLSPDPVPVQLGGVYIVTASARIDSDGLVSFPEARLARP